MQTTFGLVCFGEFFMTDYDVFNGDADGICALIQLRNAEPRDATLVTGIKRDIALLNRLSAKAGDRIVVLDVSLDKNRDGLTDVLESGAEVFYVDHHFSGDIPTHAGLTATINTAPNVCTSLLVNRHLNGQFAEWALVGTFGDNLKASAAKLAEFAQLDAALLPRLERLGILINYNAYGASIEDLHFAPDALFRLLVEHATPSGFLQADQETFQKLDEGYEQDMAHAHDAEVVFERKHAAVIMLPDAAWSRRVSGVYGNDLANRHPERAHAVVTEREDAGFMISVRAPLSNKTGADEICRQFPTGGGRKAAAGVNDLPVDLLDQFIDTFQTYYSSA